MDRDDYLQILEKNKSKKGRRHLIKHLKGGQLTPIQAILAKCYDCTGFYADPQKDCQCVFCPLYPWMPYNPDNTNAKHFEDGDDDEKLS